MLVSCDCNEEKHGFSQKPACAKFNEHVELLILTMFRITQRKVRYIVGFPKVHHCSEFR